MNRYGNRIVTAALVCCLVAGAAMAQEKGAAARRVIAPAVTGVVNLNTASVADLVKLPKVGPATAQRIVEFREKNGGIKKVEELLNVRGIGEKGLEVLRPHLALTGATTLKPVAGAK